MVQKKKTKADGPVGKKRPGINVKSKQKEPIPATEPVNEREHRNQSQSNADMRMNLGDIIQGFVSSSSQVVQKAASILEEEIAAGIVAAKEVENKFVNVQKIRTQPREETIQRFRHDSHEIVDILLDLLDVSVKNAGGIAKKIINIGTRTSEKGTEQSSSDMPVLNIPGPLMPGTVGSVSMLFENSLNTPTGVFTVACTDLLSSTGGSIPAQRISFSPQTITIGPRARQEVNVMVAIPEKTKPGVYSGLIQATDIEQLRAVLVVTVQS